MGHDGVTEFSDVESADMIYTELINTHAPLLFKYAFEIVTE